MEKANNVFHLASSSHYIVLYFCSSSIKDLHSERQTLQQKANTSLRQAVYKRKVHECDTNRAKN